MAARSCSSRRHRQHPGPLDRGCERSPEDPVGFLGDRQPRGRHARRSVRALHLDRWGDGVDLDGGHRRRLAHEARGWRQRGRVTGWRIDRLHRGGQGRPSLLVCSLPGCSSPRTIGAAQFNTAVSWTPDGRGVAYAKDGNLWVQPLSGGAPRQLTRFTDGRPIRSFAWSRDGQRLAITRSTVTNDIVLFEGLN